MDGEHILNHVEDLTAEQLFEFIEYGLLTLDELEKTGKLDASKRNSITVLLNNAAQQRRIKSDVNNCRLEQKRMVEDAERNKILEKIKENIILKKDKELLLNHVEDFTAEQLFEFIKSGLLTLDELKRTGKFDASKLRTIITLQKKYEFILNHVEDIIAEQLFAFIESGLLTPDELRKTGKLDASKRNAITALLNKDAKEDKEKFSLF